jgi:hypothetical protein
MQHAEQLGRPSAFGAASLVGALPLLFISAVLSGAFLLFAVEPMFTKMLLPLFGGSPAVWNTALIFYQVTLLAGYGYAHVLRSRLPPLGQVAVHGLLAISVLVVLPIRVRPLIGDPNAMPIAALLGLAVVGVGLPFFVLAANSSLMQSWYARYTRGSVNPYALFAASNLGSLAALVAYPLVIEPNIGLKLQSNLWGLGYSFFAFQLLGCAALMLRASRSGEASPIAAAVAAPSVVSKKQVARWIVLAALPSSLMLGVTAHLEDAVASMPLLWTLPLALYLATFVIAFGLSRFVRRERIAGAVPYALVLLAVIAVTGDQLAIQLQVVLHLAVFFVVALYCHATLNAERPAGSRLTEFYLWLALGGALGGIFNALIAPQLFSRVLEYPLALVAVAFLLPRQLYARDGLGQRSADFIWPALLGAGLVVVTAAPTLFNRWIADDSVAYAAAALVAISFMQRPVRFALALAAIFGCATFVPVWLGNEMLTVRDFFGVKHVTRDGTFHTLTHGGTLHGIQSTLYGQERRPLSYYGTAGPLGDIVRSLGPQLDGAHVAVTGLGVGTVACYARPGQSWTFYDIDPQVVAIASNPHYFRYLSACAPHAQIVLGDARLSLARAVPHADTLMILDAYSSDQVPLHLITKEAFEVYLAALSPHGLIAVHISNRYFDLSPVLANIADDEGMVALERIDDGLAGGKHVPGINASDWVVMARNVADLGRLAGDAHWHPAPGSRDVGLWTDDYSSLIRVWRKT